MYGMYTTKCDAFIVVYSAYEVEFSCLVVPGFGKHTIMTYQTVQKPKIEDRVVRTVELYFFSDHPLLHLFAILNTIILTMLELL